MDKFDISKWLDLAYLKSLSIRPDWLDWTIIIDLFGIVLAVIGFFGLAPKIEALFRRWRDDAAFGKDYMQETIKRIFPIRKNWKQLVRNSVEQIIEVGLVLLFAALVTGNVGNIWSWISDQPIWKLILIVLAIPIGMFWLVVFARYLANRWVRYTSWLSWAVVSVLAYPPAGVLGSIGLLITVVSFVVNRMS